VTSKRRKGFPSETHVKRGVRIVHGDVELTEKLGRNDRCPCNSGRLFQAVLPYWRQAGRRQPTAFLSGSEGWRGPTAWSLAAPHVLFLFLTKPKPQANISAWLGGLNADQVARSIRRRRAAQGLSCDDDGLGFGGDHALIEAAEGPFGRVFRKRPIDQINRLLSAGYGAPLDLSAREPLFDRIAESLTKGDLASILRKLGGDPDRLGYGATFRRYVPPSKEKRR